MHKTFEKINCQIVKNIFFYPHNPEVCEHLEKIMDVRFQNKILSKPEYFFKVITVESKPNNKCNNYSVFIFLSLIHFNFSIAEDKF